MESSMESQMRIPMLNYFHQHSHERSFPSPATCKEVPQDDGCGRHGPSDPRSHNFLRTLRGPRWDTCIGTRLHQAWAELHPLPKPKLILSKVPGPDSLTGRRQARPFLTPP